MSVSTNTLLGSIEWAKKMNFNRPSAIGNFLEPALTSANIVKQTMLGPPFGWWWNSIPSTFTCNVSQPNPQDYSISVTNFGWIDNAAVQDPVSQKWTQIPVRMSLSVDSVVAAPRFICPLSQDSITGNITFRLMPIPDKNYNLSLTVQQSAPLFTILGQTWAPIPDYLSYIYNWGFLAMMWMFADDPRWTMANQKFISHLLGAAQGLDATARNIFLQNWDGITQGQNIQQSQGYQARGV